jgi:two-component system sensor histidine kinase/response regulator
MAWRAPWGGARDHRVFFWAAAATILVVAGFVAWVELKLGGDRGIIAFDDISEGIAALVAAIFCALAARRNTGRPRLGWMLLSASAATWCAGEIVWSVYEVGLGVSVPYPSAADVGFLGALPLAAAGVLSFFSPPRGTSTRLRLWLDGAIILVALFFVSWTLGLKTVVEDTSAPLLERIVNVAYPIGDIVIGTILVLAIRRARDEAHGRLLLLLGGLAANSLADTAFALLNANGTYGAVGSVLDVGWVAGYLMIGLAALWPAQKKRETDEGDAIDIWQLALPWVAILFVGVTAMVMAFTGNTVGPVRTFLLGAIAILVMITQVYAHNESRSLLIKTRQYAATLNEIILYAPLGVVRIGLDMTIIQSNPRFAVLLGRPAADIIGTQLASYLPPDAGARVAGNFSALSDGSVMATESETEAIRGDGTSIWLRWSTTAVHGTGGGVDYFIGMFDDTTARHQAEVSAVANISVLERLNRLKSQFLTMVSHEIRTALVGIQGFSELLRDTEELDLPSVKGFAGDIYNDAHHLDEMLDRMLAVDRIEAEKVDLHLVPVDLGAALREAFVRANGSAAKHAVTTDIDPGLPQVAGDPLRLAQVIDILIGNAVKHSPAGSEITGSAHRLFGEVVIGLKDRGAGVPPDFDEKLLARRWSADNPTTKVSASDHGLPMARRIVEMHGGRIWFESAPGVGSEFHFSVPVRAGEVAG